VNAEITAPAPERKSCVSFADPDGCVRVMRLTRPGEKVMSNIDEAAAMSGSAGPARGSEEAGQLLPDAKFMFNRAGAALVVIDPQNDFLSPDGAGWPVFGQSVTENKVIANLARLFESAESSDMTVAVSPHYEYPADGEWRFGGPGERLLNDLHMFARSGPLTVEGLPGSGADSSSNSSDSSSMGRRSSPRRTRYGARRATTSRCSYESAASRRSSSLGWPRTSAWSPTCVIFWRRASRL
jgi:hypothetical protein